MQAPEMLLLFAHCQRIGRTQNQKNMQSQPWVNSASHARHGLRASYVDYWEF